MLGIKECVRKGRVTQTEDHQVGCCEKNLEGEEMPKQMINVHTFAKHTKSLIQILMKTLLITSQIKANLQYRYHILNPEAMAGFLADKKYSGVESFVEKKV